MDELLGQSVVVENRPGAAGNLAAEVVASAPADGYTLFMTTLSSQAINPHIYSKLRFDPIKSFEPISLVAKYPLLLVVAPQIKVNSVPELIAYVKKSGQQSFFSSAGNGSPAHLAGEMFKARTGGNLQEVVSRSSSIISDKIMISEEIETKLTSNKTQFKAMNVVPIVLVLMLRIMSKQFAASFASPIGVVAITVAIGLFIAAYRLGDKIMDVKG